MKGTEGGNLQAAIMAQFPNQTYEDWLEAANKSLKGKTVSEYVRNTYEDIPIKPLYTKADLPKERKNLGDYQTKWKMAQLIEGEKPEEINENLLEAIEYGQQTISIKIPNNLNKDNVGDLFKGVNLNEVTFFIDGREEVIPFYQILQDFVKKANKNKTIEGFIGFDPVMSIIENQYGKEEGSSLFKVWCDTIKELSIHEPQLKSIFVDGRFFEQTGGNAIQQIAFTLSTAVEQIERLKEAGVPVKHFFEKAVVGLNVRSDFFMEIAKLRAIRYLWFKLAEAYQMEKEVAILDLFAETTMVNKSKLDSYTNMLRTGGEAFAAIIGQVQTLRVQPFDAIFGKPGKLGVRVARSIHHLLQEESRLANVKDPANGSYFIEHLTNELIEKSWRLFLEIEKSGGLLNAYNKGIVQQHIQENRKNMLNDFYHRKTKLIGTNQYVDLTEELQESNPTVESQKTLKPVSLSDIVDDLANGASINDFFIKVEEEQQEIVPFRLSEAYEKFRFAVKDKPPKIGLIGLGLLKDYKKITDFVSDFCASGGILAEPLQEEINLDEISIVVANAKEKIIGFAGTDEQFEQAFPIVCKAIEQNRDKSFLIAGLRDKEKVENLKNLGVKFFIDTKANHVETLQLLHEQLGGGVS